ncbi:MAG: hypothetical protein KDA80_01500 [Planctomycetaceae bacterium]|nr:hypothetical protein [Planctomycetaceae bacterium]
MLRIIIPLGLLTAVIMALPGLVIIGYVFLVIPGLILTVTPTVFVYLLATWIISLALPRQLGIGAAFLAFFASLGMSALLMQPWRTAEQQKFVEAALPDVLPVEQVRLTGDVLIEWPQSRWPERDEVTCDSLCVALLDAPGVTSVTRRTATGAATFRKGADTPGELVVPDQPQDIFETFAKLGADRKNLRFEARRQAEREILADWALRIAEGEEFRKDEPLPSAECDWTISFVKSREEGQPQFERLEVQDKTGRVRVRTSLVKHFVPARFFYYGFDCGDFLNSFRNAKFYVGGDIVSNQQKYYSLDPVLELLRSVEIALPVPRPNVIEALEGRLLSSLANPQATDAELMLGPMWISQFQYNADPEHLDTIAKILMDERIADPSESLRQAFPSRLDLTPLRSGLARRYFTAADPESKNWYVDSLIGLPDGTFAEPTDDERAIWDEALSTHEAAAFVERMADQGRPAIPDLLALLDESLEQPWHGRWRVLRGICEAFKRLGPEAIDAAPRIHSMIQDSPHTLLNSSGDRREWLVALYLMGTAVEDLPFGIETLEPAQIDTERRRLERLVEVYQKSRE